MSEYKFDPSLNVLHNQHQDLNSFFYPQNVAVIGATEKENSVGRTVLWNLIRSPFGGTIYPVNTKRIHVLGIKAYPDITKIPVRIDLAIIVTPASTVVEIMKQCALAKVKSVVIISAGFKEVSKEGELLEKEIKKIAKSAKIRVIGPNCIGIMNTVNGLNATFAKDRALKGTVAFISQSGALCTAVLDWSLKENVGFSSVVSVGSMVDVDWGDLINYFGNDPHTNSILIYMESIDNPRSFLSAAREVALTKPIILIKAGRTEESAKAAFSHTGALAGSDEVLNAALNRVGVLRVSSIIELFRMGDVLAKLPPLKGPFFAILTNAGGPGVLATDSLIENGVKMASLSNNTLNELNEFLPKAWSHNNPIDILGDADANRYVKTLEVLSRDINIDGILIILTPQFMTDPTKVATEVISIAKMIKKPILTSWMGSAAVEKGSDLLHKANILNFVYPDAACESLAYMWRYSCNLKDIYETPRISDEFFDDKVDKRKIVKNIFKNIQKQKRCILNEIEAKEVLKAYGIPINPCSLAKTKLEAVKLAKQIKYPVVMKLVSNEITHKSDVGGVILNIKDEKSVKIAFDKIAKKVIENYGKGKFQGISIHPMIREEGYELIFGCSVDEQFGPVLLFGTGGTLVEVLEDNALGLPPLNTTLARRVMERTKIYKALHGIRGQKTVDIDELEKIFVRFSNLIAEHSEIKEIDINPMFASSEKIIALDARIVLYDKEEEIKPLAIRPYPLEYIKDLKIKDGTEVTIRPTRPDDEPLVISFYKYLSQRSLRQRYLEVLHYEVLTAHERLIRICCSDYDREIALVVEVFHEKRQKREILAISRLTKIQNSKDATFAIIVQDSWQHKGIGSKLLEQIIEIAKKEKIANIFAQMLHENKEMKSICKKHNFKFCEDEDNNRIIAKLKII